MHDESMIEMTMGGQRLRLSHSPGVFAPNTTTRLLFDAALPVNGLHVLDLGCGIGPVAIAAAFAGAESVTAVDVMPEACSLTIKNAQLNGVGNKIQVLRGNVLRDVGNRKFDLIISDISGIADTVARLSPWYPPSIPTGGSGGGDLAIEVIESACQHLNPGGRLVFPVIGLSQAPLIEASARRVFGESLAVLLEKDVPFHRDLYAHREVLAELKEQGLIDYTERGSRLCWKLQVIEARV